MLVKHGVTYIRVHLFCLKSYPETYQSSFEKDKIEHLTKRPEESTKVAILEDIDLDKDLETPNNNVNKAPTDQSPQLH